MQIMFFKHISLLFSQILRSHQAFLQYTAWNCQTWAQNSVSRKSAMDSHHSPHLSCVLPGLLYTFLHCSFFAVIIKYLRLTSDPSVWHHELRLCRSLLLDPCHPGFQQRNAHGVGHFPHRHIWPHHATFSWRQDYWSRWHSKGQSSVQRGTET